MSNSTITVVFTRSDMPAWAEGDESLYQRCLVDLAFRCSVFEAAENRPGARQWRANLRRLNRRYQAELAAARQAKRDE